MRKKDMNSNRNLVRFGETSYRNPNIRRRKFSCDSQNQILYSIKELPKQKYYFPNIYQQPSRLKFPSYFFFIFVYM